MPKDHIPSDFNRKSGYKSDLEIGETQKMAKSINTSFGGREHNAYVMRKDGTHEHFYYNPSQQRSGWHGGNYPTRHNHPKSGAEDTGRGQKNHFVEGLRAQKAQGKTDTGHSPQSRGGHTGTGHTSGTTNGHGHGQGTDGHTGHGGHGGLGI